MLVINPVAGTLDTSSIPVGTTADKWPGAVLAPNGRVVGIPLSSGTVLLVDAVTMTADVDSIAGLEGNQAWFGGVLVPGSNSIVTIPYNSDTALVIDLHTNTTDAVTFAGVSSGANQFIGGVMANTGVLYTMPFNAQAVLAITPGCRLGS